MFSSFRQMSLRVFKRRVTRRDAIRIITGAEWTRDERSIIRYFHELSSDHSEEILKASWKPYNEKEIPPTIIQWHGQIGMENIAVAARSTSFRTRCEKSHYEENAMAIWCNENIWKDNGQNESKDYFAILLQFYTSRRACKFAEITDNDVWKAELVLLNFYKQ